ncbi:ShlB/FhaC/HecB family hemolysin secretion/activation protein [Paludibacterium sp. THUN1379]|uniref:ShlB/FhaC/HecB family hemolysin secretion/activation protein n=1 Tax=Paludibacterium sp. THUN1379 TaxID=3112107 RepID=UPI0030939A10|nr:ShlB/FhaC/HecB family hemolysin secretion/activation protein [Paludibacterium sp. THUN1379]
MLANRVRTRRWVSGVCLACWHALLLAEPSEAPGTDGRFFLQDNSEHLRGEFDALRQRQLLRDEDIRCAPAEPEAHGNACLPVRALRVTGVTLLGAEDLALVREQGAGCMYGMRLQRILQRLMALYVERGYVAARVVPQLSADGVMTLQVLEGHVEEIEGDEQAAAWLFPAMSGKPLNIRDLEQGLDQANRLQSAALRAEIVPGRQVGGSTVRLRGQVAPAWHGRIALDNWGYDATGRQVAGLTLARDNLSGRYDYLSLALEHSLAAGRFSRRHSLFYSLPHGYWSYSLFAGQSAYLNPQRLRYGTVALTGESSQLGLRLDRVLWRDQQRIWSTHGQVSHKRVANYFLGSLQQVSSPTLSVLSLGVDRLSLLAFGSLTLELSLDSGQGWFGADDGVPGGPSTRFDKWRLSTTLRHLTPLPGWQWESRLQGQYSGRRLPAVEQLELADNSMVRGFRHNSLASERGWVWRNTLHGQFRRGDWQWLPRLGLDLGGVWQTRDDGGDQRMAGWGLGMTLRYGDWSLDGEYSRPLWQPDYFVGESQQVLLRLSRQF